MTGFSYAWEGTKCYEVYQVEQPESEAEHRNTLKLPPTKQRLSSPDVAALLTPFHDRLLAFEAKHRNDGTAISAAGTVPSSPTRAHKDTNGSRGTAAEALIRALHASRNAYAATLHADYEADSRAMSDDVGVSAQPSPSRGGSVSGRSGVIGDFTVRHSFHDGEQCLCCCSVRGRYSP